MRTFGGPFSNHLHAVAALGHAMGFATHGIVRGITHGNNATLADCRTYGMHLSAVSKHTFDRYAFGDKSSTNGEFPFEHIAGQWLEVAPGAAHRSSAEACAQLGDELASQIAAMDAGGAQAMNAGLRTIVVVPAGYGTTAAGIISGLARSTCDATTWVVPAMLGPGEVTKETVRRALLAPVPDHAFIVRPPRYRRFAPPDPALIAFANQFHRDHGVQLDPIYTAKMMDTLFAAIANDEVPRGTRLIAVHTGGLQAWRGIA